LKLQNHKVKDWINRIHFVFLIIVLIIFIARVIDIQNFTFIMPFYSISGELAAILFAITLIPGSLQRLKFLKPVYAVLIYYRRQIGILFYVVACFHFTTRMSVHPLFNRAFELFYDPIIIAGSIALLILLPVYLVSNNFAMKLLKRKWKAVQRLTYFAYFFITWHLYLVGHYKLFYLYLGVVIFVMISWVYHYLDRSSLFDESDTDKIN
jgi:DMSO/TMAO reductase YedYZ heme-binding membrane subunit